MSSFLVSSRSASASRFFLTDRKTREPALKYVLSLSSFKLRLTAFSQTVSRQRDRNLRQSTRLRLRVQERLCSWIK